MKTEFFLERLSQGFSCKTDKHGRLCIVTPFAYPDDDLIEVFVEEMDDGRRIRVSDLGETARRMSIVGKGEAFYKALKQRSDVFFAVGKKEEVVELVCQIVGLCFMLSRAS